MIALACLLIVVVLLGWVSGVDIALHGDSDENF
jgi:hypothetical protein